MQIANNVHLVKGVMGNPYLIADPAGLMLIDTGLPGSQDKILKAIAALGLQPADLRWIVITHADADHTGGLNEIQGRCQARTYTNSIEADSIRRGKSSRDLGVNRLQKLLFSAMITLFRASPAVIDETVEGGFEFPVLGGLEVINTPGHSPGHISLYSRTARILFAGDSIRISADKLIPSTGFYNWDEEQSLRSFQIQADLHPMVICGGHGWTDSQVEEKFSRFFQFR